MARFSLPDRFRRRRAGAGEEPAAEPGVRPAQSSSLQRRHAPSPGALRRERRAILRAREERIRDLGGLVLEMYRQDRFREDLLIEQCHEVISLEARLQELDSMLTAATALRRAPAARCECGAPVIWGSHFCANCGRPVGEAPVVSCASCGHSLPADAHFCANCGKEAEIREEVEAPPEQPVAADGDADATMAAVRGRGQQLDPWES